MTTPTTAAVRAWARGQGLVVADRGRLPASVLAAYTAAHPAGPPDDGERGAEDAGDTQPPALPHAGADNVPDRAVPDEAVPDEALPDASASGDSFRAPGTDTPRPPRARTDRPSLAAALTGVLPPLAPLAVVLGVVGVVRTRRSGRPGRGLALAGLVAGVLWLVALGAAAALSTADRAPERAGEGTGVRTAGDVLLEDLEPGDCLRRLPRGAVTGVRAVPCDASHRAEVYAVFDLGATTGGYPGNEEVRRLTDGGCDERAAALGLPEEGLAAFSFSPDGDTWALGDREVVCVLQAEEPLARALPRGVRTPSPAPASPSPPSTPSTRAPTPLTTAPGAPTPTPAG